MDQIPGRRLLCRVAREIFGAVRVLFELETSLYGDAPAGLDEQPGTGCEH